MSARFFRHLWGIQGTLSEFLARLRQKNLYDGIEAGVVWLSPDQKQDLLQYLKETSSDFIGMVFTDLPFQQSFQWQDHVEEFKRQVEATLPFNPLFINAHSGKDFFSAADEEKFFEAILDFSRQIPTKIIHETHRGRILFHPKRTVELLQNFPDLRLCLDVSHWICSSERLLNRPYDELWWKLVIERTDHIHARVGHEEGPQVPVPRASQWEEQTAFCEKIWQDVFKSKKARNQDLTLTPEYGPFPYATAEMDFIHQGIHLLEKFIDEETQHLRGYF